MVGALSADMRADVQFASVIRSLESGADYKLLLTSILAKKAVSSLRYQVFELWSKVIEPAIASTNSKDLLQLLIKKIRK